MWRCSSTISPRAARRITRSPAPASPANSARGSGSIAAETDTVAWLIEYHLLMSEIAQARDLQDPETAHAFADIVQSPQRLALLMILTACDIRAVGPGRLDRLEGLAAALALLRHRAAAVGRPFARHPVRPHRRRQGRARKGARRLAGRRARDLYGAPLQPLLAARRARAAARACQDDPRRRPRAPALRRLDPRAGLRGHH